MDSNAIPLPGTIKLLEEMPRVANSTKAPCRLQKEIAAQNSYIATIKEKREIVYVAPCVVDKAAEPKAPQPKPTS